MENIRVFEEGGYIHFILRPEELMRLRYSEQSTIAFSAFMDGWLGQMKTQVRENTIGRLSVCLRKAYPTVF